MGSGDSSLPACSMHTYQLGVLCKFLLVRLFCSDIIRRFLYPGQERVGSPRCIAHDFLTTPTIWRNIGGVVWWWCAGHLTPPLFPTHLP